MDRSTSVLPFDVLDTIIGIVDTENNTKTLKALSTTCSAFLKPSRQCLFRQISTDNRLLTSDELTSQNISQSSSHLASYVRLLTCWSYLPVKVSSMKLILNLYNIETLVFMSAVPYSWSELDTSIQDTVAGVLRGANFKGLRIQGHFELPFTILTLASATLHSLEIGSSKFTPEELEILHRHLPALSYLRLAWVRGRTEALTLKTLLRAASSLTHLHCDCTSTFSPR